MPRGYTDLASYQLTQQQRRDQQFRDMLNMMMASKEQKTEQARWEQQQARLEQAAQSLQGYRGWQVDVGERKLEESIKKRKAAGIKQLDLPDAIVADIRKTHRIKRQWSEVQPKTQNELFKSYLTRTRTKLGKNGDLTLYQKYQIDKNFVTSILNTIKSTMTNFEDMMFTPEEATASPEIQRLRRAQRELTEYLKKKIFSAADKNAIFKYSNIQAILDGSLWGDVKKREVPTDEFSASEIMKQKK